MLNDRPRNFCRPTEDVRKPGRFSSRWEASRIVVVDPVLASRVELAQAISQPGLLVESASTVDQAHQLLSEHDVSLILVDHNLHDRRGLELLTTFRDSYPSTRRVLVTDLQDAESIRPLLDAADLSFVIHKPWDAVVLRQRILESLDCSYDLPGWRSVRVEDLAQGIRQGESAPGPLLQPVMPSHRDLLVRGLLAGLNACENQASLFRLIHTELFMVLGIETSLWLDEKAELAFAFRGKDTASSELGWSGVSSEDAMALCEARAMSAGGRLTQQKAARSQDTSRVIPVGFSLHESGEAKLTLVMRVDDSRATELLSILGALRAGLGMALRRIHTERERARAAEELARRVSAELRNPVGALANTIAALRSEVKRSGIAPEWIDRVTNESERVVQAVKAVEQEMRTDLQQGVSRPF